MASPNPVSRPGGRTARTREVVLAAVGELLIEGGFDALSVDAVSQRSGVHRSTVYRRWASPAMLLVDLLNRGVEDDWAPPDTGSLEGDLIEINRMVRESLCAEPSLDAAIIAAAFRAPEAATALRQFWQDRYQRCAVIVERAIERGEVDSDVDVQAVLIAATGPLYHQKLLLGTPLTEAEGTRYARRAARAVTSISGEYQSRGDELPEEHPS